MTSQPHRARLTLNFEEASFSSPAHLVTRSPSHRDRDPPNREKRRAPTLRVLTSAVARTEDEVSDEEEQASSFRDALATSAEFTEPISAHQKKLLSDMRAWASATGTGDSKPRRSSTGSITRSDRWALTAKRHWNDERVIIFTEYRDTQKWLFDLLESHGLGGDRLAQLYGGMDEDDREHVKAVFQAHPRSIRSASCSLPTQPVRESTSAATVTAWSTTKSHGIPTDSSNVMGASTATAKLNLR